MPETRQETTPLSLASNINRLIRPHVDYSSAGKIVKVKPLLTQLTDFIGSNGASGSSEPPIPGSIKALSAHVQMEWDAKNYQYEMTGDDSGGLWAILESWENVTDDEWQAYLENITLDFIDQIQNTIEPPRPRRPLRQPCSACGQRWIYDEDNKRTEAVTAWVWDSTGEHLASIEQWEVHCALCGAQWHGKEVAKAYWRAVR